MIEEVLVKTHLIVTDVQEEYKMKWCGCIIDTKPKFKDNKPIFILIGSGSRVELNTINMEEIERCAKHLTVPKGRGAISTDKVYVYIVEENEHNTLIGIFTHNRIKHYSQMFDKVGYK